MFFYFGYGSNINLISLKAKGVFPLHSEIAVLYGWRLRFNVEHWFRHEGGVGNIEPSSNPDDFVEGVVHTCADEHLASLDAVESYGVGYDRTLVSVSTQNGIILAQTYTGLPGFINNNCLPSQRYLNIILKGATAAGLSPSYIDLIRQQPVLPEKQSQHLLCQWVIGFSLIKKVWPCILNTRLWAVWFLICSMQESSFRVLFPLGRKRHDVILCKAS